MLVSEQPAGSAKKREVKDLEAKGSRGVVTRVAKTGICKYCLFGSWTQCQTSCLVVGCLGDSAMVICYSGRCADYEILDRGCP